MKIDTTKKKVECYYCHKPEHIISNCLKRKRDRNIQFKKINKIEKTSTSSSHSDKSIKTLIKNQHDTSNQLTKSEQSSESEINNNNMNHEAQLILDQQK